jgi:hypothetical protein
MGRIVADRGTLKVEPGTKMPSWTMRKVGKKELEVHWRDSNGEQRKARIYWKHGADLRELAERAILSSL